MHFMNKAPKKGNNWLTFFLSCLILPRKDLSRHFIHQKTCHTICTKHSFCTQFFRTVQCTYNCAYNEDLLADLLAITLKIKLI